MSRLNTTSGAHSSGVGQAYDGAGLIGAAGYETTPWTFHLVYKRSGFDSANKTYYIGPQDGADVSDGYIAIREHYASYDSGKRIFIYFYDPSSGYNRFRFQYSLSLAQFGTDIDQPADDTLAYFTVVFGTGATATNHTSTVPALYVNGARVGLYDSYFGASSDLPTCLDQVIGSSDSGNNALLGNAYEAASWTRGLTQGEVVALHRGFAPSTMDRDLHFYNSQIRNLTKPEITPSGVTSITDTHGSVSEHDAPIIYPAIPQFFPSAFPPVTLAIPTVDADTAAGVGLQSGELVAIPTVDADTAAGVGLVTGYASPMVGIRNVLSTTIEALTPPEDFDRAYVRAPTFSIPDGVAGFRMFTVTVGGASNIRAVGPHTHQIEHDFEIRVRISTGVESLEYQFSDLTNEAMKLMSAINDQNLSTVSGADFVECEGFETEEAESEDTDLILICRAMTQETT